MMETIPQTPTEMTAFKAAVASMPIYINALVSPDGKAAAVVADFKQDETTPNFIALNADLRKVLQRESDGTVDIYLGGLSLRRDAGRNVHQSRHAFERDGLPAGKKVVGQKSGRYTLQRWRFSAI